MKTGGFFLLILTLLHPKALSLPGPCGADGFDELIIRVLRGGEKLEVGKVYWHRTDGEVEVVSLEKDGTVQVRLSNGEMRDYDEEMAATLESCNGPFCS